MGEAAHLIQHLPHRLETRTAMPPSIPQLRLLPPPHEAAAPLAIAQVGREDRPRAAEDRGLRVRPLLAVMLPLETVVVEPTAQREARWDVAFVEDEQGRGPDDLVDVGDN